MPPTSNPAKDSTLRSGVPVILLGPHLRAVCRRCGQFGQTTHGHLWCGHVHCPVGLREWSWRRAKRRAALAKVVGLRRA